MKRFLSLLLLIGVVSLPIGCDSPKSAPAAPSGGSSNSFTYPFAGNIGSYFNNNTLYNSVCDLDYPFPSEFSVPVGSAVSGDYLFVSDPDAGDIQVFTTQGVFITQFWPDDAGGDIYSEFNCCDDQWPTPVGLATDNKGHLFEADPNEGCINVFNISDILSQASTVWPCQFLNAYGTYWADCPVAVAVDNSGIMYVSDACGGLGKIAPDFDDSTAPNFGEDWITSTSSGASAIDGGSISYDGGIAVNSDGTRIYYADHGNNVVQVYDGDLNSVGFLGNASGSATTVAGEFDSPYDVHLDNQGNLLVLEDSNSRVQRLTTSGTPLNMIGWYGSHTTPQAGDLNSPAFLAVDPNDDLFVTDTNTGTVFKYTSH